MIRAKQSLGTDGVTYFTIEKDEKGWKAVVTRNKKVIKSSYGLHGSKKEAQAIRGLYINQFWSFKLN
jgi:hypothetical protein